MLKQFVYLLVVSSAVKLGPGFDTLLRTRCTLDQARDSLPCNGCLISVKVHQIAGLFTAYSLIMEDLGWLRTNMRKELGLKQSATFGDQYYRLKDLLYQKSITHTRLRDRLYPKSTTLSPPTPRILVSQFPPACLNELILQHPFMG